MNDRLWQGKARRSVRALFPSIAFALLLPLVVRAETKPAAVPTFECLGLYWKVAEDATNSQCEVGYRALGAKDWKAAMPLWFDPRNQEYRGSIVNLRPDTTYEISLSLKGTATRASLQTRTWSETSRRQDGFPGGAIQRDVDSH